MSAPIMVNEQFKPLEETKSIDAKNRVTFSPSLIKAYRKKKVSGFAVFLGKKGDILLRPMSLVPSQKLWAKRAREDRVAIKKGLEEIKAGKGTVITDLDTFFKSL